MRNKRNRKRRLSVQNLETRKLFAADVGFGDMTHGSNAPAEIGAVRPGKVERPVFGPHIMTFDSVLPEQLAGSASPGGDDIFTEQVGGSADPGGDDIFTEQITGSASPGGDDV